MLAESREICTALAVAGSSLGQSTAPLHYYSTPHDDLVRVYANACTALTGLHFGPLPSLPVIVGAPLAAGVSPVVRSFIAAMKDEIHQIRRSADEASWHRHFNLISAYTARMWGAATGHRLNSNLDAVSLAAIDARGWAIMADKSVDSSASIRAVALPKRLIRQIETLRLLQRQVMSVVNSLAKAQLKGAIDGHGPLFLRVDSRGQIRPITPDDLRHKWLDERTLPRNIFRVHLRMGLTRLGASNELIFRQMGHVNNGFQPYGDQCPVSIREHSELLSDMLERLLSEDGWDVLPVSLSRQKPLENWPCPRINSSMARDWKQELKSAYRRWRDARKHDPSGSGIATQARLSRTDRELLLGRIDAWVLDCLRVAASHHTPTSPAREVEILEDHILVWVDSLLQQDFSPDQRPLAMRRLRIAIIRLRKQFAWKGSLPPRLFEHRFIAPVFGRPHVQAAYLFERIRASVLLGYRTAPRSSRDELTGRLAVTLILDYTVFNQAQLQTAIDAISQNMIEPDPAQPAHVLVDVLAGQNHVRAARLSRTASVIARAIGNDQACRADTFHSLAESIANILPKGLLPASRRLRLDDLFALQRLAARVERAGVIWPLIDKGDLQTFTLADTLVWRRDALGRDRDRLLTHGQKGTVTEENEDRPGPVVPTAKARAPNRPSSIRLRQYQEFRAGLYERCESAASDQGLDHFRFTHAKKWCEESLADLSTGVPVDDKASIRSTRGPKKKPRRSNIWESVDPTNRLLIEFVLNLLASKKKIRVRTIYDYLTGIGIPLLKALDDRGVEDLDGDELDEVLESVVDQTPDGRKAGVASRLLRFYWMFEDRLAEADTDYLRQIAGSGGDSSVRAAAITLKEYEAVRSVLDSLFENHRISALERLHARNLVAFMYRFGLRTKEVIHRVLSDVVTLGDHHFLYIRATSLGLVKTRASRRFIDLSSSFTPNELQDFRALCDDAIARASESQRKSPPLFLLAGIGESAQTYDHRRGTATDLLRLVRTCLKHLTGTATISLHSLRHSVATRSLADVWLDRPTAPEVFELSRLLQDVASRLGQSDFRVTFQSYFHLAHLVNHQEGALTSSQMEALTLEKAATIRQREARLRLRGMSEATVPLEPQAHPPSSELLTVAKLIQQDLVMETGELIPFLSALGLGHDLESAIKKLRVGERMLAKYIVELHELGRESTMIFFKPTLERDLLQRFGIKLQPRTIRYKTLVPGSRHLHDHASLRALARSFDQWTEEDMTCLIRCSRKQFVDMNYRETDIAARAERLLTRSFSLDVAAWVAAISVATRRVGTTTDSRPYG